MDQFRTYTRQYRGTQAPIQQNEGRKSHLHDSRDDQLDR